MVFGSVQEFCQEMFKTMIQATEHHALVLRPVIFVAVLLILWRIYRFNIVPLLRPDEPKELPYWIPCTCQPPTQRPTQQIGSC